jgi:hypothetical protein
MTQLKTLRELADQVGFPFDAVNHGLHFHCIGISPKDQVAIGWSLLDDTARRFDALLSNWSLVPKKKIFKSFIYEDKTGIWESIQLQEDPKEWCERAEARLIKITHEVEVEV